MTAAALALVLAAAVVHATWNLLAKRVSATTSAPAFVWLYGTLSAVLYTPPALWLLAHPHTPLGARELGVMTASAIIHLAYFLVLQRGYRTGDLSVVYPLARGTGPLLSSTAAIILLGERPTPVAIVGALAVAASVFLFAAPSSSRRSERSERPPSSSRRSERSERPPLSSRRSERSERVSGPSFIAPKPASSQGQRVARGAPTLAALVRERGRRDGIVFGLATGLLIALYTVWDKYAVATLHIPPLLMEWSTCLARAVLLAPVAAAQWPLVREAFARHRAEALAIGALNPLSYLLVMIALVTTPVSYVAPAREISILIGVLMGGRLLGEGDARRRVFAAALMLAGVLALSVG